MKVTENSNDWLVVYTMSRAEKKIQKELARREIECFLPLHKVIKQWSDRKKKLELPLFPNYLFVRPGQLDSYKVLMVPGVVKYVKANKELATVREEQIDAIKRMLHGNPEVSSDVFVTGAKLRVTRGPLQGLEGVVVEKLGRTRIAMTLEIMNRTISAEVNPADLESIDQPLLYQ